MTNWTPKQVITKYIDDKTGERVERTEVVSIYGGGCNHYYVQNGDKDERTGLTPYSCQNCPNGISLGDDYEVIDGKPSKKENG